MTVTVKGCLGGEFVLDTDRYPELGDLLRGIIAAEFLGEPKPADKKRGRPPKQPQVIAEATLAPAENGNAGPVSLTAGPDARG
jgi:hypothetical protein